MLCGHLTRLAGTEPPPPSPPGESLHTPPPGRHDVVADGVVRDPPGCVWRSCPLTEAIRLAHKHTLLLPFILALPCSIKHHPFLQITSRAHPTNSSAISFFTSCSGCAHTLWMIPFSTMYALHPILFLVLWFSADTIKSLGVAPLPYLCLFHASKQQHHLPFNHLHAGRISQGPFHFDVEPCKCFADFPSA